MAMYVGDVRGAGAAGRLGRHGVTAARKAVCLGRDGWIIIETPVEKFPTQGFQTSCLCLQSAGSPGLTVHLVTSRFSSCSKCVLKVATLVETETDR